MKRLLFFIFIAAMMACQTESNLPLTQMTPKFQQSRHDALLDQKIQPILNQYFLVISFLKEKDSANLQSYGLSMIHLADSLSELDLSPDTITKSNAVQGLINIQYEMTAILMESNPEEREMGANMLSLHFMNFLASIGYQMQNIYLFSDEEGNNWMGMNKKSVNPFHQGDKTLYEANQILNELK